MEILTPSPEILKKYLAKWDSLENYVAQESSLRKLFTQTYPENKLLDDVLIKVCSLNDFYSTNIFSPFAVAKHIVALRIDENLSKKNLDIVNKIAEVKINGAKSINFYFFATKYYSHHSPKTYPIYDSFVEKMLIHFKKKNGFPSFRRPDLKTYPQYHHILSRFRSFYGFNEFDLKQTNR